MNHASFAPTLAACVLGALAILACAPPQTTVLETPFPSATRRGETQAITPTLALTQNSTTLAATPTFTPTAEPRASTPTAPAITPTATTLPLATATPQAAEAETVIEIARGFQRPHGLGVNGADLFVSSELQGVLYRTREGQPAKIAALHFAHDMVFEPDGALVTPIYNESRVVRVRGDGSVETLARNLKGPNGIARSPNGYFLSAYNDGTLYEMDAAGKLSVFARDLQGPAGIAFDQDTQTIYVAEFLAHRLAIFHDAARRTVNLGDLRHPESLGRDTKGNLWFTAVRGTRGVVAVLDAQEKISIVLESDLPDPLVGHFTADGFVYLVSPNDPQGRVLRAKVY